MPDLDLTKLPKGERGRQALLEYVKSSDDRLERYFLEVKSAVDLNTPAGRAKVAKFILGASNRDPVKAARRFDGHALMVLGVAQGTAAGIPAFEAMDLESYVRRVIGTDGPGWDYERIPVDDDHDVIVVLVDPPTGQLWTCRADGDGLVDGGIYVRDDGSTRRATGDEVRDLIARHSQRRGQSVDVGVEVVGEVAVIDVEEQVLLNALDSDVASMLRSVEGQGSSGRYGSLSRLTADQRSHAEFRQQVEAWRESVEEDPVAGIVQLVAHQRAGIQLRVVNRERTYLRDVRVELMFDAPVRAANWLSPLEPGEDAEILLGRPRSWGSDVFGLRYSLDAYTGNYTPRSEEGIVHIKQESPAHLTLSLKDLRPDETRLTDDDDVVLVICPGHSSEPVTARWRVTAADVHDVFEGEVTVDAHYLDMREAVLNVLGP